MIDDRLKNGVSEFSDLTILLTSKQYYEPPVAFPLNGKEIDWIRRIQGMW